MVKINLLPDVVLERRKQARLRRLSNVALAGWGGALVLVLVLSFGYSAFQNRSLARAEEEKTTLNNEVNSEENVAFRAEALAVQASLDGLNDLFASRQSATVFWNTLAAYAPDGLRIRDLNFAEDGSLLIDGIAQSYETISLFERRLKRSIETADSEAGLGYFSNVALLGSNVSDESSVAFEIRAMYYPPQAQAVAAESMPLPFTEDEEGGSDG